MNNVIGLILFILQISVMSWIYLLFGGGWDMFWLLFLLYSLSFSDGYYRGINKK